MIAIAQPEGAPVCPVPGTASTAVLASMAFERAASCPPRSPGRLAAATARQALTSSSTTDVARRRLEVIRDPALREAALAVLADLEQLLATEEAPAT